MTVNCNHWKDCGVKGGGCCAINAYEKPSHDVCLKACTSYTGEKSLISKAVTLVTATVKGKYVSKAVVEQRMAICQICEHYNPEGSCKICGCGLSADEKKITNLAAYEEKLPSWGCKHPRRSEGYGWPE